MTDPIEKLRKLAEAATQGPLDIERRDQGDGSIIYILHGTKGDFAWFLDDLDPRAKRNAEMMLTVRNALPALLDLVEAADRMRGSNAHGKWLNDAACRYDTKRAALAKALEP